MPAHSDFLPFAAAPGANVATQAQWIADPVVPEGFTSGILPSSKTNKALRQATFVAAGVAEMMRQTLGFDVLDDGNLGFFAARLSSTIVALGGGSGVGGAVPEAPMDGRLYGRGNSIWLPTIAKSGDTMTGPLVLSGNPTVALGAATKQYVDAVSVTAGNAVQRAGDTMTGTLVLSGDPVIDLAAAPKRYVDALRTFAAATYAPLISPALTGSPTTTTPATVDNSTRVANTAFVKAQNYVTGGPYLTLTGGTITGTTPGSLIINRNTALPASPGQPTALWTIGATGESPAHLADSIGSFPNFLLRRANGTVAAPGRVNATEILGALAFRGYGLTNYSPTVVRIAAIALDTFSDIAQGTQLTIDTTPVGGNTTTTQVAIGPGLAVGASAAPAGGMLVGDLSAQRIISNNFAALSGMQIGTTSFRNSVAGADLGPGGLILSSQFIINRNTAAPPLPPFPATALRMIGADGENITNSWEAFAGNPNAVFRRANGTGLAPSHINNGDNLGALVWRGYGATAYGGNNGRIVLFSLEDWTDVRQGSQFQFITCPIGTTTTVLQALMGPGLTIGVPAAPAGGMQIGDINCQRLFVNGVAVTVP